MVKGKGFTMQMHQMLLFLLIANGCWAMESDAFSVQKKHYDNRENKVLIQSLYRVYNDSVVDALAKNGITVEDVKSIWRENIQELRRLFPLLDEVSTLRSLPPIDNNYQYFVIPEYTKDTVHEVNNNGGTFDTVYKSYLYNSCGGCVQNALLGDKVARAYVLKHHSPPIDEQGLALLEKFHELRICKIKILHEDVLNRIKELQTEPTLESSSDALSRYQEKRGCYEILGRYGCTWVLTAALTGNKD